MKKLNQIQQLKVETAKEAIVKLQEAEEIIYSNLVNEIGEDNDWLYDYIFNCSTFADDAYTNRVKNEIFE
ncbi:MAG: hypothetical protein RJB16_300 [Bacteroidota bacterium]|jgi:hypothetical protein